MTIPIPKSGRLLAGIALTGILAGGLTRLAGAGILSEILWALTTAVVLVPLALTVVRDLRRGEPGVDLIALLAMAGSLALSQHLAGAVIALMLSGGQALEAFAGARARRELAALLARAPKAVHRYKDGVLTSPPIEEVRPGDLLLVKPGEVVPVDGLVEDEAAVLDEAALTGESRPVERPAGELARSGTVNGGAPFRMRAVAPAAESTYAGIVRLVREAEASKAPFVRLADRYALIFLPLTLGIAGIAWALSGDPVRALAVLVVATPCPLILAAPVAILAGVSRSAHGGVIVKGGQALEALARARVLLLDKTGTITDVVVTVDRLDRLAEALAIARRSRFIAVQSVVAGMGLSLAAMLFAAAGYLPPVAGALLQEAIDVAVILNALRALGGGQPSPIRAVSCPTRFCPRAALAGVARRFADR